MVRSKFVYEGALGESIGKRLFNARLELIGELDRRRTGERLEKSAAEATATYFDPKTNDEVRLSLAELLHRETAAMNPDNFVVRPRRRIVEKYAKRAGWAVLSPEALSELSHEVAGLPSELGPENEEAKRFDLLVLNLQLAMLRSEHGFSRLRDQVKGLAGLLEEKSAIPMVRDQMALIHDVQTDEWWQDATVPMLEVLRRRLRDLIKLIEKQKRKPVYTDFEDLIGDEISMDLPGFVVGTDQAKFRAKVQAFLRQHLDHVAVAKLHWNKPLTASDLAELERMLAESGIGGLDEIQSGVGESRGLGLFVRSLVGLDRQAAKGALAGFSAGKALSANQLEFINLVVDHLTEHGVMGPARLYESPLLMWRHTALTACSARPKLTN